MKNEPEHLKESIENKLNNFKNIKIAFNNIYVIDENTNKKEAKEYINKADIVFLLGGCPYIQMEIINKRTRKLILLRLMIFGRIPISGNKEQLTRSTPLLKGEI